MKPSAEVIEYSVDESQVDEYRAYLIRMWRSGATQPWCVSLQGTKDRERHGFPDLATAFTFLQNPLAVGGVTSFSGDKDKADVSKSIRQEANMTVDVQQEITEDHAGLKHTPTNSPTTSSTPSSTPARALHRLLSVTTVLHAFDALGQELVDEHFSQENLTPVDPASWQTLCYAFHELRQKLSCTFRHAQILLAEPRSVLRPHSTPHPVWSTQAKRRELLELLERYKIDERITQTVDVTLLENARMLLDLLELDWKSELLAHFESQLQAFSALVPALEGAVDAQTQARLLAILLPPDKKQDDMLFDVFSDSLLAVNDVELTLAAIAFYLVVAA